jgi:hypothetical protein
MSAFRGKTGKYLLVLSFSQFDPNRSFGSGTKSVIKDYPKRRDDRRAAKSRSAKIIGAALRGLVS